MGDTRIAGRKNTSKGLIEKTNPPAGDEFIENDL